MAIKKMSKQEKILITAHHDFNKGLNTHAFFKVNNHATGEDLVQETFIKTWKYLVRGGEIDTMKAFLYHILNNLIIDEYRKRKSVSLDDLLEKGFEPSTDDSESKRLFDVIDGKAAALLVQRLPSMYREIIRMRFIQDLSLKEISLITGQTKNAIAVKVHRGLEKLKVLYESGLSVVAESAL
jgi:RNA polymerase sigma-70 factor (ECF subfamily)